MWVERLCGLVRGAEFYAPHEAGNPAPGHWSVVGPLSECRFSAQSIEHAAQLYLAQVCRDPGAQNAFRR